MAAVFAKYEGLGNDFIVIDATRDSLIEADRARQLCDRHFGIGADGVLLVLPAASGGSRARMVVLNADGSRPEMCGNGIRCVALHLARQDGANALSYVIDTDAGPLLCEIERDGDSASVRVGMGRAVVMGNHRVAFDSREIDFCRVSMGNPHLVSFEESQLPEAVDRLGPAACASLAGGSNVEFARPTASDAFDLVVWERGVGRTLACGTGAAATAVAAAHAGKIPYEAPVKIRLPGGTLELSVARETLDVTLRGPARRVFSGELA